MFVFSKKGVAMKKDENLLIDAEIVEVKEENVSTTAVMVVEPKEKGKKPKELVKRQKVFS